MEARSGNPLISWQRYIFLNTHTHVCHQIQALNSNHANSPTNIMEARLVFSKKIFKFKVLLTGKSPIWALWLAKNLTQVKTLTSISSRTRALVLPLTQHFKVRLCNEGNHHINWICRYANDFSISKDRTATQEFFAVGLAVFEVCQAAAEWPGAWEPVFDPPLTTPEMADDGRSTDTP